MARRTSREAQIEEPIEVVEEESGPGMGIDIGIGALTTVTLIAAIIILMMSLGRNYAAGPFGG